MAARCRQRRRRRGAARAENVAAAQAAFAHRARMNGLAAQGKWKPDWRRRRRELEARCRLYLITPPKLEPRRFRAKRLKARAGCAGDVASLQLRLKDVSDDDIRRATRNPDADRAERRRRLHPERPARSRARSCGCDGVHIGQEDASYAEARAAVGPNAIVGVTCHNSRASRDRGGGSGRRLCRLRRVLSDRDQGRSRRTPRSNCCAGGPK